MYSAGIGVVIDRRPLVNHSIHLNDDILHRVPLCAEMRQSTREAFKRGSPFGVERQHHPGAIDGRYDMD
jgi:hypothetical protein